MSIFRQLTEKPWETVPGGIDDRYNDGVASLPAATIGLRIFLAVVTVLFMLLIVAYGGRMAFEDWRPGVEPRLLWLNTAFLIASSVSMQWALAAARRGDIGWVINGLYAGGVLTIAFLAGQVMAWWQLATMAYFDVTNPAIAFFYLITALHALHLVGGIVAWGRTMHRTRNGYDVDQVRQSVERCSLYWHFMLLVWMVVFALLFSGNDNLGILLTLCGIR